MWDVLWSRARIYLRLSDEEFFALTPRQLQILFDRYREQVRHQELLNGILAAAVVNHSWRPPEKAVGPGEFMPMEWSRRTLDKPQRMNRKAIAQQVRVFLKARVGHEF